MPDVLITIRTQAELAQAKAVEDQLQRQIFQAKLLGKEYGSLEQQLKRVQGAIATAPNASGGLMGQLQQFAGAGIGGLATGIGAAAAAIGTAKKAIEEFAQAEERVAGLDAALAQAGLLTDQYRERLQELAGQLQETTGIADDEWIGVLKRLTQFGSTPQSIGMDVEAVKNLAGIVGNVSAAADLYSKALQGQFQAFSRYGIVVDEAADKTEKLQKLQEQLALRGGGQLEAVNQTLNGQFRVMRNNVADLLEAFGLWISRTGFLQTVLYGLGATAKWLADQLGGIVPKVDGLKNAVTSSLQPLEDAETAAKNFAEAQKRIKEAADEATTAIRNQIRAIRDKEAAESELTDAELGLTLEKINQQEAAGKMTPEKAIRARSAARIASDSKKRLLADQADREEIGLIEEQMRGQQQKKDSAQQSVQTGETQAALLGKFETLSATARQKKEQYRKELSELLDMQAWLDEQKQHLPGLFSGAEQRLAQGEIEKRRPFVENLRREAAAAGAAALAAKPVLGPGAPATAAQALQNLPAIKKQAQADARAAEDEMRSLGLQRGGLEAGIGQRSRIGDIQNRTESLKGATAAGVAAEQEQKRQIEEVKQEIQRAASLVSHATSVLGGTVVKKYEDQASKLEELSRRIGNIERRSVGQSQATK